MFITILTALTICSNAGSLVNRELEVSCEAAVPYDLDARRSISFFAGFRGGVCGQYLKTTSRAPTFELSPRRSRKSLVSFQAPLELGFPLTH
jgi:hypothetical protein